MPGKDFEFDFFPSLIVRTPLLPISSLLTTTEPEYLSDQYFIEALFLASPELSKIASGDSPDNINKKISLAKYYNRMCFRCTPFGLFAACSIAGWGPETKIELNRENLVRRSRPDKEFLAEIIARINTIKTVFNNLPVTANNTIYPVCNELRMIEREDTNGFKITSVERNNILEFFLSLIKDPESTIAGIIVRACSYGYTRRQALTYLQALADNQIILPGTSRTGTAGALLSYLIALLTKSPNWLGNPQVKFWAGLLVEFEQVLNTMDQKMIGNGAQHQQLIDIVGRSGISQSLSRVIQVDSSYNGPAGTVNVRIKRDLEKAVGILKLISTHETKNPLFEKYKANFIKKYDRQEVPLLLALDPEFGISYFDGIMEYDNFLGGNFAAGDLSRRPVNSQEPGFNLKILIEKFEKSVKEGNDPIKLDDNDLKQMDLIDIDLSSSVSVFFRLFGDDQIQIETVGGSSAINLFTRFTDFDEKLYAIAKQIAQSEQEQMKDVILAEVIHEPEARSANVNAFPSLRKYIIPYYSEPLETEAEQIQLSDILLSVVNNKFVLRSEKLDKMVIPKISSAYNFLKGSPIYRFFGDMQTQYGQSLNFDFRKILPDKKFYPRLSYKNLVFATAIWKIDWQELSVLETSPGFTEIQNYLISLKLPQLFVICEGDNELLIDRQNKQALHIFMERLRKRKVLYVREFLFDRGKHPVSNQSGEFLNDQIIAILFNNRKTVSPPQRRQRFDKTTQIERNFSLGSEWLYYKFYCGIVGADHLLSGPIFSVIDKLNKKQLIKNVFFIRYADPDPHIRLRFQLRQEQSVWDTIKEIRSALGNSEKSGQVWKIQTENYSREIERYRPVMILSEKIFGADSLSILKLLKVISADHDEQIRFAVGLRLINDYIDTAAFPQNEKIRFIKNTCKAMKIDCKISIETDKKINQHYRERSAKYIDFIYNTPAKYERIFKQRQVKVTGLICQVKSKLLRENEQDRLSELLTSYIHMSINRLFYNDQKTHEYVLYDYLLKIHLKEQHINKIRMI